MRRLSCFIPIWIFIIIYTPFIGYENHFSYWRVQNTFLITPSNKSHCYKETLLVIKHIIIVMISYTGAWQGVHVAPCDENFYFLSREQEQNNYEQDCTKYTCTCGYCLQASIYFHVVRLAELIQTQHFTTKFALQCHLASNLVTWSTLCFLHSYDIFTIFNV